MRNITFLARQGFYDGMRFHRLVPGFLIQAGASRASSRLREQQEDAGFQFEVDKRSPASSFRRGTLGLSVSSNGGLGASQFFITFGPLTGYPDDYPVLGQAVSGSSDVTLAALIDWNASIAGEPDPPVVINTATVHES